MTDRTLLHQYLGWTRGVSATITNVISPLTDTFTRASRSGESNPTQKREQTVSFDPSTNVVSLIYPQIDVPVSKPQLYRRKSSPPMPSGEHNAAARSRLRAKSERRSIRRRRQTMATIQCKSLLRVGESMRDGTAPRDHLTRKLSCVSTLSTMRPSIPVRSEKTKWEDHYQQRPAIDTSIRAKSKQKNHQNPHLRLKSSSTLDAPAEELFEPFTSSKKVNPCTGCLSERRRKPLLDALLISPKTVFPNPTSGLVAREHATAFTNSIPISRKKKDLSTPPVSSSYYLWHLFVDGKGPTLFTAVDGRRGSGWTIDTPTLGRTRARRALDSVDGIYHPEMYGRRTYNRESGFWAWSTALMHISG